MADQDSPIHAPTRTIVDGNLDVFRYGLFKYPDSEFEDPTYLGYTIEIDENSALFTQVRPFLEKQGGTRTEINARLAVYEQFVSKVVMVFKSQESVESPDKRSVYVKSHYINSVSGMDLLRKKFIKWREDKLTVELHEDIAMFSTYLSHLYNNLTYSYENGRALIPENLLKFNLYIKISEVRSLTSIGRLKSNNATDQQVVDALKNNVTCLIYKLYDCEFDFFGSSPVSDSVVMSGIDASNVPFSVLSLDIYFKSVSRQVFNPLVKGAIAMNDNKVDLDLIIVGSTGDRNVNGQASNGSETATTASGDAPQSFDIKAAAKQRDVSQEAFKAQNNSKKPSDISTYDAETANNPDAKESFDLQEVAKQRQGILDNNKDVLRYVKESEPLSPLVTDPQTFKESPDPGNVNGNAGQGIFQPGGLSNLTNKVATSIKNTAVKELDKAVTLLKQKRNALVRNFIGDLEHKVGLKRIVPDNVYYGSGLLQNTLDELKADVGLTIGDAITKGITGQ